MKKVLPFIAILLLALSSFTGTGQTWTMQHPYPTFNHLYSVSFPSANIGYIGGENGTLMKTTDGAKSWEQLSLPDFLSGNSFTNLTFLNNDTGYFAGGSHIFKTVDGGLTWQAKRLSLWATSTDVFFLNDSTGYASGRYSTLFKTTNAGESWNEISFDTEIENEYTYLKFANDQTGYLIDHVSNPRSYTLKRTDDGGITWTIVQVPDEIERVGALEVLGTDDIWIGSAFGFPNSNYYTGEEARAYHTTDGGVTWTVHTLGMANSNWAVDNITFLNELQGRVVSYAHIYETNDGGITWTDHVNYDVDPDAGRNSDIGWLNPDTCYIAGYTPSLLRTYNSGDSIEETFQNSGFTYRSVYFSDTLRGFTGGWDNDNFLNIRYTEDGGETWTNADCSSIHGSPVTDFHFYNANNAIAVFTGGILRSSNGGYSWTADTSHHSIIFPVVDVTPDGTLLVAGYTGKVCRSVNNGTNWTEIFSGFGDVYLREFQFIDNLTGFMLIGTNMFSNTGIIYKTTDGGYTWTPYEYGSSSLVECFNFFDSQHGIIGLTDKTVIYTHDGGQKWQLSPGTFSHIPTYIRMFNSSEAVIVGDCKYLATTNNGGQTFQVIYEGSLNWPNIEEATCFVSLDHGWSVGDQGMIQKFDAHTTAIESPETPVITSSFLSPNPASESIRIIDVNGSLTIRTLSGGTYLQTQVKEGDVINISQLPAGIYIATVVNDKEIRSSKLVISN